MTKIGDGFVEIHPDLDKFRASLEKQMASVGGDFRKFGKDAGSSFGDGFARGTRDVDRSTASLSRAERQARRTTKGFEGLVSAAGGGDGNLRKMGRALDDFGGASAGATATLGGFRVALAALVPLTIGFGGATVSVVSALGPLVGLAAAAGNALAAAAQGFGAFKLATMGVTDALKETIDNQDKAATVAASNAGQQRAAARAIQSAQDGVRSSLQALSDAQAEQRKAVEELGPAYMAARMRLTDLRAAVADAALSLQSARISAEEARKALADLLSGPDPRKLAEAHKAVDTAVRGEEDAVQGLRDAYKALNDLLKPPDVLDVADATDAVADALRNQERAQLALNDQAKKTNDILANQPGFTTDEEKAKAKLDLADAENAVGDAARASQRAQEALAKIQSGPSQDEIAAARKRVSDAERQVTDATDATKSARADLAQAEKPASSLEIAKARLDVAQAENAVRDAERDQLRSSRDLQDAERKGIDRSDEVVAARDAIAKADRRVEDAEHDAKRASQALSDAQLSAKESAVATAAATANLTQKMDKLPPAAQAFVKELVAMKPRLDELRQTAAQGFFPGATEGLKAAMGSFSSVNKVLGETSVVLGDAARKSGELVGSPAFGRDIEIIGGRNAKVIDTLGEALRHVISALRNVAVAAGPLTQWLADLVNKWALNASEAAKAGRETGKLAAFFERTRAVVERLGSILGHLASGLLGIGRVGQVSGNQILASIDAAAARFDAWANSVRGRREIQDFFQQTRELAAALVPVLAGITSAVGLLVVKIFPLSAIMQALGPYTDEATTAFIAYKVAALGAAVATRAATAAMTVATFVTGGWVTAFWALNAALYANPIGLVVVALAALVGGLVLAYKNSETFRNVVDAAFRAVASSFGFLLAAAKNTFGWLRDNWPLVLGILTGPIGLAVSQIATHWGTIRSNATSAWNAIKGAAGVAWDAIRDAILAPVRAARDAIPDIVGGIANRLASGFDAITKGVGVFAASLKDAVLDGVRGGLNLLIGFINDIIGVVNKLPFVDIGKIDKIAAPKASDTAGPGKKPGGFARGGAFARTGGIVDRPIVLMGEEAPTHPEFVIPTNPAYRDRARALLQQAWGTIGFAAGGTYSKSDLAVLWKKVNPGVGDPNLMAAIALAESGGRSSIVNSIGAGGLWQIYPPEPGYLNPETNARIAGRKLQTQGLKAWEAYTNGSYKQFLGADKGGGILGAITGVLGDLLSKGASLLLDKLPSIGGLPSWLSGLGKGILSKAVNWIQDQVSNVLGLRGDDGAAGGGVTDAIKGAMAFARSMGLRITSTTGGEHVANSYHYRGRALDAAGTPAQMSAFFSAALNKYGAGIKELFYDPRGAIKNGQPIPAIGGHSDHVHLALARGGILPPYGGSFATGGIVPGPLGEPRLIEAHAGEAILPGDSLMDLATQLRILNNSPTAAVVAALVGVVNTSQGRSARHRSMTAGRGGFPATP